MIDFGIKDAIDILCVAFLLYYFFKIMKDSGSMNTFFGIVVFFLLWIVVSPVLEMKLMGTIFDKLVSVGVLALIILFQEDIRRFFLTLGSSNRFTTIRKLFTKKKNKEEVFSYLLPLFQSKEEYTVRFACVMILNYYTDDEDLVRDLAVLEPLSGQPFYAKMAVAWALSILYLHHRQEVCEFLKKTTLDDSTVNLAVRKILESRLVKGEERDTVRALKR